MTLTQLFQTSAVISAQFNTKKSDLLLYVTEDNKITIKLMPKYQHVTENLFDFETEELFVFEKDRILVKKKETLDLRVIPVFISSLIDDLSSEKKFN